MRKWTPEKLRLRRRHRRALKRWQETMRVVRDRYWRERWFVVYGTAERFMVAILRGDLDPAKRDAMIVERTERIRQQVLEILGPPFGGYSARSGVLLGEPVAEASEQAATGKPALQVGGGS